MNQPIDPSTENIHPPEDPDCQELESYLETDETRLGDVYRGLRDGLTAEEIAAKLGVTTSYFVWNNSRMIDAILDRDLPQAPTVALPSARKFRTLLKNEWSPAVRERLQTDLAILESRATDVETIAEEVSTAQKQTEIAEEAATPGIYVYALRCRRRDGCAAILKVTPEVEFARGEDRALRSWGSSGRVPASPGVAR